MSLASSSVSVSLALCPASEPAAARRASSESHHPSASRSKASTVPRAGQPSIEVGIERARLDVALCTERIEQPVGERTVLLEPVAAELLGRELFAAPDDEDELDHCEAPS